MLKERQCNIMILFLTSIQGCSDVKILHRRHQTLLRWCAHAGLKEETKEKHIAPAIYIQNYLELFHNMGY